MKRMSSTEVKKYFRSDKMDAVQFSLSLQSSLLQFLPSVGEIVAYLSPSETANCVGMLRLCNNYIYKPTIDTVINGDLKVLESKRKSLSTNTTAKVHFLSKFLGTITEFFYGFLF